MTTTELAREFSRRLREEIGAENLNSAIARNAGEVNSSVCHSHDFCDANTSAIRTISATRT